MTSRISIGIMMTAALALLTGCAENKVTRQHYDMIMEGKSNKSEVEMTLGKTYADRGDHWEYDEEDRHLSVVFYFDEKGMVQRKEWIDAKSGKWEGSAPGIREPENQPGSTMHQTIKKD
jgi:hypothetical protein